jgi:hypothetical protein
MPKLLIALRQGDQVVEADFATRLAGRLQVLLGGGCRWTLELAQPGQDLLVAAGLRFEGQAIYDALLWCWFDGTRAGGADKLAGLEPLATVHAVLRLDERPVWDRSGGEADPLAPNAVKMVSFVVRRREVQRTKFERDYAEHVAVARLHHPGVWRYVQNLVLDGRGAGAEGVEAVSELWYPSGADFLTRFYATDESPGVVKTDNEEYIDFSRTRSLILVTSRYGVA